MCIRLGRSYQRGCWTCSFGGEAENPLKVYYTAKAGVKVDINKALADTFTILLGAIIPGMAEGFAKTLYQSKGLLPAFESSAKSSADNQQ